jgi:hypothetical protein
MFIQEAMKPKLDDNARHSLGGRVEKLRFDVAERPTRVRPRDDGQFGPRGLGGFEACMIETRKTRQYSGPQSVHSMSRLQISSGDGTRRKKAPQDLERGFQVGEQKTISGMLEAPR